ncbi:MAG: hypothetical protein WCC90_04685, partial [Methylocella sp.]
AYGLAGASGRGALHADTARMAASRAIVSSAILAFNLSQSASRDDLGIRIAHSHCRRIITSDAAA